MKDFNIREATQKDHDGIWEIFSRVVESGDTYAFDPKTPKNEFKVIWLSKNIFTYVLEKDGSILGTYFLKANQLGLGNHIANGGYMVHPDVQGQGIGKLLCEHSLIQAKELGFSAIQFNFVVSTNKFAIKLWKKYGFNIIGTVPDAFRHQKLGLVAVHIMHKKL